jgi:hypothetical protein
MGKSNTANKSSNDLLESGAELVATLTGVAVGQAITGHAGEYAGAIVGPIICRLLQEFSKRRLGRREKERLGAIVIFAIQKITIVQISVCLVSYRGDQGSWVHRLYRRDLRVAGLDPVEETIRILDERRKRAGYDQSSKKDTLTDLARRGIMTYAERAVLMNMAEARWRMGHGNPAPYELLTGSGMSELLAKSLSLLSNLVDYEYFVFVPSSPGDRTLLTIGDALRPMEYAIVDTLEADIDRIAGGHYRGDWAGLVDDVRRFGKNRGSKIVKGLYRASAICPAQLFYAHLNHAHEAAMIAIADSVLQDHRGFPMLIDLADNLCRATFGR